MNPPTAPVSLTIAVCTFNRAALLTRMLASIQRQTKQDFDVLILDDCSSDGTRALCEGISGPRFRYVRNATNLGFNANYNQALTLAKTSHVLLTHDDDFMDPTFIEYLSKGIVKYPEALMITTNVKLAADETPVAPSFLPLLTTSAMPVTPATPKVINGSALGLTEDVVYARGEYGRANYWKGLGLYCPTFCFHRERCIAAKIAFEPVGPGSDVLISLRTNFAGPVAVLCEPHFNVCVHAGQDHSSVVNELTATYRLERVAVPLVCRESVFAEVRPVARFNLSYHFGKASTAVLVDLADRPAASAETVEQRYARHLDTLPVELRDAVFSNSRNRVAARLFGHASVLTGIDRISAADQIRAVPQLLAHSRKWNLVNYAALDRLEDQLADGPLAGREAPAPLRNRRVVIWAFSYLGVLIAEVLRQMDVPVVGFVDRNAKIQGSRYRDLVCRSWPATRELLGHSTEDVVILTATEGTQEVDVAFDLLGTAATGPRCEVHNWRAAVDWIAASPVRSLPAHV